MKSKIFVPALCCLAMLCGCAVQEKYDLLKENGEETRDEKTFLYPFSKVMKKEGSGWLLKNPDPKVKGFCVRLQPLELDTEGVYSFKMRYVGKEKIRMTMQGAEYAGKEFRWYRPWMSTMSFLNVNGETVYSKEFALSPGTTSAVPLLLLNASDKMPADVAIINEISVKRIGTMKRACPEIRKINLAAAHDFNKHPEGTYKAIVRGRGAKAAKWSNVKAEVIKCDGGKVLHIVRNSKNYIYPFIKLADFPVDPRYHFVRVTFQARGKGSFCTGLWWNRKYLGYDYENAPEFKMQDQWQTFTMVRPCLTPGVVNSSLSFTSRGDGEFFIRNISVTLE